LKRVAFVVQRYGEDVVGGAETLCRNVAERLAKDINIDVLTTCAKDYHTWANYYPQGKDNIRSVKILRFPVDHERKGYFKYLNRLVFHGVPLPLGLEYVWMGAQGPYSSGLFNYIAQQADFYDVFVFFTYLYCTTFYGLPLVQHKSLLVPTAHDEPPLRLKIFQQLFTLPRGFIFMTEEEKDLVQKRFNMGHKPYIIAGSGIDINEKSTNKHNDLIEQDKYILYLGRIDSGKNTNQLINFYIRYVSLKPENKNLRLFMAGHCGQALPKHEGLSYLGFVSDEEKERLIKNAIAVVQPSVYESLSLVALEAMALGTPVLVNAGSEVLAGHCRRSGGGVTYTDFNSFAEALNKLTCDIELKEKLGFAGRKYVKENYSWDKVKEKYLNMIYSI